MDQKFSGRRRLGKDSLRKRTERHFHHFHASCCPVIALSVDTDKDAQGQPKPFGANSRLVVIGFRDKDIGFLPKRCSDSEQAGRARVGDTGRHYLGVRSQGYSVEHIEATVVSAQPRSNIVQVRWLRLRDSRPGVP